MAFTALLDACVLLPYLLCDLLLRLADKGTYRPLWSAEILGEVERNLLGAFKVDPSRVERRLTQMRIVFPDAMVDGYQSLLPTMTNHPKDRHVPAAAVRGQAAVIVTANLKDFKNEHLQPYDLAALHPDDFLRDQLELYPLETLEVLAEMQRELVHPSLTVEELLDRLRNVVPEFVDEVRAVQSSSHPTLVVDELDLAQLGSLGALPMMVQTSDEDSFKAFFPNGFEGDRNTPRRSASCGMPPCSTSTPVEMSSMP